MSRTLFASLLFLGLVACDPAPVTPSEAPPEAPTVETFESPYFTVSVSGQGPDVILLPGLASSAAVWDGTVAELADDFRLHVIQVSGFGGAPSRGNANNTDMLDDLATDLARYTTTLEQAPGMVGHSLGGLVTLKTALRPDARLDEIIIVDVLPFFSVLMDEAATADSMAPVSAVMKATLLSQPDAVFVQSQEAALAALVKNDADRDLTLDWSITSDRNVMAQAMSEVLVTDLRADIGAVPVPTTVIYARDAAIPNMDGVEAFYADLYAPLTDGKIVPIDHAFHFIMLDQPDAFHAALRSALTD